MEERIIKDINNLLTQLFQKMKEAGYEWNAEKKLLKKIEHKPDTDFSDLRTWKYIVDAVWTEKEGIGQYLDSPFTEEVAKKLQKRFGNIEQKPAENKGMNLVEEEMTPFQKKVFCIIDTTIEEEQRLKQVCDELLALASNEIKQKPAYSEDYTERMGQIINYLTCQAKEEPTRRRTLLGWVMLLKSIFRKGLPEIQIPCTETARKGIHSIMEVLDWAADKGRISYSDCEDYMILLSAYLPQPKPAWSEEDENLFKCAIDAVREESKVRTDGCLDEEVGGMVTNWLKSLKNRVQPQQITEWSEEDERQWNNIWDVLDGRFELSEEGYKNAANWFKSLKDRVQPKNQEWKQENTGDLTEFENAMMHIGESFFGQHAGLDPNNTNAIKEQANTLLEFVSNKEWSEEDEKEVAVLEAYIRSKDWSDRHIDRALGIVDELVNKVKSLRPQPKQEWSEEDINMIDWLIRCCEKEHEELCNDKYGHQDIVSDLKRDCRKKWDWLESLKNRVAPQNQWKPTKKQTKALKWVLTNVPYCGHKEEIYGLLEQLEQL